MGTRLCLFCACARPRRFFVSTSSRPPCPIAHENNKQEGDVRKKVDHLSKVLEFTRKEHC